MEKIIIEFPIVIAFLISLISSSTNVLIKIGSKKERKYFNKFYLFSYLVIIIFLIVMPFILKLSEFNLLIAIIGFNYIFIFLYSKFYFKEVFSLLNYFGCFLTFIGLLLLNI